MKGKIFDGVVICIAGVALIAVNAPWLVAACPDRTVRNNSPCVTQANKCAQNYPYCSGFDQHVYNGRFQCDIINVDTYCIGSGNFEDCYLECDCTPDSRLKECVPDATSCQLVVKETKVAIPCPDDS